MIGILGKKLGMTRLFNEDGSTVPVTVIEAGPCQVLQVKTPETDGYHAIQLGFDEQKPARVNKPRLGHFAKAKVKPLRFVKEMRVDGTDKYAPGTSITVDAFNENDYVDVTGTTIGRGFQGGIKRWGWAGGKKSHGSMHHRAPGSVGASSYPSRVFKGHHMPGRMGGKRKTIQSLRIVKVDKENNLLLVKGCIPGHKNSYLIIKEAKKHPIESSKNDKKESDKTSDKNKAKNKQTKSK